ncbi:MAG: polyprenyl synthetase family protein [Nocardioidaceae bacterium]
MTLVAPRSPVAAGTDFVAAVEGSLRRLFGAEARRWLAAALPGGACAWTAIEDLYGYLDAIMLGGGKRLRPRFCSLGHAGVAGQNPDETDDTVVMAAAALELLHAFALVHDDVMDGSPTRRGGPSLHARIGAEHGEQEWRGERRRVAEGTAILVGDLAFTLAHRLAGDLPLDARGVWHDICAELVVGQRLDMYGAVAGARDPAYTRLVASLKSGRYTVVGPLLLGATLAGGGEQHRALFRAYGEPLGDAFQLRDDLLGVFGDPAVTGKPVGDDLRDGSPTLLLALATQRADAGQRRVLELIGRPDLDERDIGRIAGVLVSTGARAEVERRVEVGGRAALAALDCGPVHPDAMPGLRAAVDDATWRER